MKLVHAVARFGDLKICQKWRCVRQRLGFTFAWWAAHPTTQDEDGNTHLRNLSVNLAASEEVESACAAAVAVVVGSTPLCHITTTVSSIAMRGSWIGTLIDHEFNLSCRSLQWVCFHWLWQDALNLLFLGDTNRVVAVLASKTPHRLSLRTILLCQETPMNDASTRSHCLFIIWVDSTQSGSDACT